MQVYNLAARGTSEQCYQSIVANTVLDVVALLRMCACGGVMA